MWSRKLTTSGVCSCTTGAGIEASRRANHGKKATTIRTYASGFAEAVKSPAMLIPSHGTPASTRKPTTLLNTNP
jgi:hypothetical protein